VPDDEERERSERQKQRKQMPKADEVFQRECSKAHADDAAGPREWQQME
jgi:hypothetical protein